MYNELRMLLGKGRPSVRKFLEVVSRLTAEEQSRCYHLAFSAALCEWDDMTKEYQAFLIHLFNHNRQYSAYFLRRHTVLGCLTYELHDPSLLLRLLNLLEGSKEGGRPSFLHLAFSLYLSFSYSGSVDYLGDKLSTSVLTTDDLCELMDLMRLDNELGHLPEY